MIKTPSIPLSGPWPVLRRHREEFTRDNPQDEIERALARQRRQAVTEGHKEAISRAILLGGARYF